MNNLVLITGASDGLGKSLALIYSQYGHNLLLNGRNKEKLENTREAVLKNNVECGLVVGDLMQEDIINNLYYLSKDRGLVLLINNAGISAFSDFEFSNEEETKKIIETNLAAPINLTRKMYPLFIDSKGGTIAFINSLNGLTPGKKSTLYCASKYGLRGFADSLRLEAEPKGIRVVSVYLGGIKTKGYKGEKFEDCMDTIEVARSLYTSLKNPLLRDITLTNLPNKRR